ncbi:anti-sigma factor family protein [Kineococcus aurantiacus]|uniref:Zinc-finger domain-containing protein n=1 Tax=Kineococcus aurantiacus TaxID=37633 RepID=A0A7Y9J285_9ACTN|nr:hypothetical protein [Kineococcus aurantiacus]NYD24007.1 hypothetical protein [Kineococcus aurantiacus]
MSGPHLGPRVTPLVDGRLAADAEARAGEHLSECAECAGAVESERLVRARLQAMATPEPSGDLLVRLLEIGGPSGPLRPRDLPIANPARPVVGVAPPSRTDPAHGRRGPAGRAARRVHRRPVSAALAGTFSLLGAGIVGVLVLGGVPHLGDAPVAELRTTPSAAPSSAPASTPVSTRVTTPVSTTSPTGSAVTSGPVGATPTATP